MKPDETPHSPAFQPKALAGATAADVSTLSNTNTVLDGSAVIASTAATSTVAIPTAKAPDSAAPTGKAKPSYLRSHRWQLLAALLALIGVGVLTIRWWLGPQVDVETVLRRDFIQTVVASGHVEAPHRIDVGVQITGTVLRIPVSEGQAVEAGALLLELESAELTATGREADLGVAQAQAKLRQLQEVQGPVAAQALRQAKSNSSNAEAALARSNALFAQGFIGQAALDDARKLADVNEAAVHATQKQLDTTLSAGSDRALLLANISGARAGAQAAHARVAYTLVKAPLSGTLIARNVEVGDIVQPGKVLMTLSPQGRTQLIVAIDEKNLALLSIGQHALVSADAYPTERFAATLAYINPGVNASTGTVEVKLDVAAPPAHLKQDMTVSVDIQVAKRAHALIVPLSAVHDLSSKPWVLHLEGRHATRRPVQLGLQSGGFAEVLLGLSEGDVVLAGATTIKAGARVRLKPKNADANADAVPASVPSALSATSATSTPTPAK